MFELPPSQRDGLGIPLHEHTGLLLINGLVQEDLDDQQDIIRGALEIDPLLTSWTVCSADGMATQLGSITAASRWLADCSADLLQSLNPSAVVYDASQRVAWREISVSAVATARLAWRHAALVAGASVARAFWLGMLCGVAERFGTSTSNNGRSLLSRPFPWPAWLSAEFRTIQQAPEQLPTESAVRRAVEQLANRRVAISELVSPEETTLWFRAYPEFRTLCPLVLRKLKQIEQLSERFEEALQREKLASLQQLAYGASHEINNPLANISTRAQTLLAKEQDVERRKKLVAINEQAFRAYEMIADLMLFAKPPALQLEVVYLDALVRTLQDELGPLAERKGVRLQFAVGESEEPLVADAVQIAVALKAICLNGIEAMNVDGLLKLSSRSSKNRIEIMIEDTGPGLSELARRHLFDPFFSGREAGRGLGFGLSKSWRIIQLHGGTIEVTSQPAQGSNFRISLPRIDPKAKGPFPTLSEQA